MCGTTHQASFAQARFATKKKTTRREKFPARMEQVIPWARLPAVLEPHYPKGQGGRPSAVLERMLRGYFLQQWYALADEAIENALHDSQTLRGFARIGLGADQDSKLAHTIVATAANVADIRKTSDLLHGEEQQVHTLFRLADVVIGARKRAAA